MPSDWTAADSRKVACPGRQFEALKEYRKWQAAERLQAGEQWQDHDLVFCREDGTPLDRWQVRREFAVITKAAGLGTSGHHGSYGTRSCPSSAPTASAIFPAESGGRALAAITSRYQLKLILGNRRPLG